MINSYSIISRREL